MTTTPKKFGGPQEGSGRPKKDTADKFPKVKITMTPEHYAATEGDRSAMVRRALDFYFEIKDAEDRILALMPNSEKATATEVFVSAEEIKEHLTSLRAQTKLKND